MKRNYIEETNIGEGDKLIALHHFNNCCCYCGVNLTRQSGSDNSLEMDHYISLSEQDVDEYLILDGTILNRVPACRKCNREKSNINPEIWIRRKFNNADEIIEQIEFYFSLQKEYNFV